MNEEVKPIVPKLEADLPENTPQNPQPLVFKTRNNTRHPALLHAIPIHLPVGPVPDSDSFLDFSKYQPSAFNGNIFLQDEFLQTKMDVLGEQKITKTGHFCDPEKQNRLLVTTFTLPGRGKRLYVMATDISKELQFRDSYLFLQKNKALMKFITNDSDKAFLIKHGILLPVFRSRTIGVVSLRSLYLIYGARLLKNGVRLVDDYWEEYGRNTGKFTEADPVFSTESHSHGNSWISNASNLHNDSNNNSSSNISISSNNIMSNTNGNNGSNSNNGNAGLSLNSLISILFDEHFASELSDLTPDIPIPTSVENHPFYDFKKNSFKVSKDVKYRLNYQNQKILNSLVSPELSDELKQNYLLSAGITNNPILSKPQISLDSNGKFVKKNVTITVPGGGSAPGSVATALLNNEPLLTSTGDPIFYVSCLPGQSIMGSINLNTNLLTPTYKVHNKVANFKYQKSEQEKIEEAIKSLPFVENEDSPILGKKSDSGIQFQTKDVITQKLLDLQNNSNDLNEAESVSKDPISGELIFKGTIPAMKRIRNLEYLHNVVSFNHQVTKFGNLRKVQFKYYWFEKEGGFKQVKKTLKRKLKNNGADDFKIHDGKYFKYTVTSRHKGDELSDDDEQGNANSVVNFDLLVDSDEEVINETVTPMTPNYPLTAIQKETLAKEKEDLLTKFKDEHHNLSETENNSLQFQQLIKTKTVRKEIPNRNCM